MKRYLIISACLFGIAFASFGQPIPLGAVFPTRETGVHDPVMIKEKNTYYVFCTGNGITVWSSTDLKNWQKRKPVFDAPPQWAKEAIPGFRGSIWAPDINYYNGLYYLFYAVSAFGKNTSCIGVAVNKTLDSASADFKWVDKGKIVQSVPGRDLWNAIDANLAVDSAGTPWMVFGSFWSGLKMVKLKADLSAVANPEEWYTVASRPRKAGTADTSAGSAAIEAPFIFKRGRYYYLFVSKDYCCQGERSNYKVVVGRSEKITGPYLDKENISLVNDGGTLVVQGNSKWYGAGHNSVYNIDGKDLNVLHGYDAADRGRSKLIIREINWDPEGWPRLEDLP